MMIGLLAAHYLFSGCGTRTKNINDDKTELKSNINSEKNIDLKLSKEQMDSLRLVVEENLRKEFEQKLNETSNEEGTRKTTTEVTETLVNPTEGFREIKGTDMFLNDANGKFLERKTKTIIEEKFKLEKQKQIETKRIEEEQKKKELIETNKYIDEIVQKTVEIHVSQYEEKQNKRTKAVVQEGFKIGFWGWFWIIFILLLIITFAYLYKKYGTPLGWWGLIFNKIIK